MPPTPSRSPALARRLLGAAIALCTATAATLTPAVVGVAHAQPLDPYGPDPDALAAGAKDAGDPEIDEAVAAALVARARELIAMEAWADAQELLGEALVRSPDGAAAAEATALLPAVKAKLGIDAGGATSDPGVGGPGIGDPIDPDHQVHDPETPPVETPAGRGAGRGALAFHLAGYGAVVGFALIDPRDQNNGAGAGVLLGGLAGGLGGYYLARRADLDMAEARTLGSMTTWGEVIGGLIGDAAGADLNHDGIDEEDPLSTVVGASIGGGLGLIAGEVLRRRGGVTTGDVALVDSLAGMGVVGGLSLGALMQPSEGEGYSINAAFGAAGGVVLGLYLGNKHEVSTRRILRVDLWAGAGAVVPWVLYGLVADDTTNNDEQAFGFLSTAGMIGGALLGRHLTRGWDGDGDGAATDAPVALLRRGSRGGWALGAPALRAPNLRALGPAIGRGAAVDVVGIKF